MEDKKKINTPEAESVEIVSPIEIISEAVKRCLDDLTSYDTDEAEQPVN